MQFVDKPQVVLHVFILKLIIKGHRFADIAFVSSNLQCAVFEKIDDKCLVLIFVLCSLRHFFER